MVLSDLYESILRSFIRLYNTSYTRIKSSELPDYIGKNGKFFDSICLTVRLAHIFYHKEHNKGSEYDLLKKMSVDFMEVILNEILFNTNSNEDLEYIKNLKYLFPYSSIDKNYRFWIKEYAKYIEMEG